MSEFRPTMQRARIEAEKNPSIEVWMIDDDTSVGKSWEWGFKEINPNITFRRFEKGEDAIAELRRRLDFADKLPIGIIVDGNLQKDKEFFTEGPNIVSTIHVLIEAQEIHPLIIAHSTDKKKNKLMLSVGADIEIEKGGGLADIQKAIEQIEKHHETP